ncbi:cation:proton antiporter [Actinoplanes regularis]|uniref:Sodium/proton antiporter, CPA1 family n=1 Tax=Actinoplanes regularis TaxID=52697 RepID=A0A239JLY4_9ACTN|nr:sodium:proton antiporter [Actinoplanes regularis]GIE92056.1 sodium/hydrogen exchanger [Actinoplanes regularis]SNT06333.1 sodium/proton antiporter, CPA1 family [Actinoplanes regularis]
MDSVQLLLIIGAGIAVSAVARKRDLEPGMIIVVLAAAASFLPGVPRLELDSEFILAVVVPPLLYSATRGASLAAFGANLRAIVTLGVLLVLLTAGVLGLVAAWLLPSLGAAAFVLGSVLAPPDTITTVSHGDEIGLPKRVTSILTGESLVNDATALTLFSIAVGVVGGEQASWGHGGLQLLRNAVVGIVIGAVFAVATLWVRKRLGNPTLETALVLLVPFTAFLVAEHVHASGILAVVAAAFLISVNLTLDPRHQYPGAYRTRLQEAAFWPVLDFVLETFVFAYIGLQLRFVLADLAGSADPGLIRTLVAAGVLLLVAIVFRLAAVYLLFGRWTLREWMIQRRVARDASFRAEYERRGRRGGAPSTVPTQREALLVGWIGMRGILTLAAAGSIPPRVPGRDAILAIALFVTLGTLLLQGTTIGWLTRRLRFDLSAERAQEREMRGRGQRIVEEVGHEPAGDPDAGFEAQRLALGRAVMERRLTEEIARAMIDEIDLRQAARHTLPPARA